MLRNGIVSGVIAFALAGFSAAGAMAQPASDAGGMAPCPMMQEQGGSMGRGGMMGMGMMGGMGQMGGGCPMMGMMAGGEPAFVEGRIAFLKAELGITDAQKDVWNAYAEALKHNFENMKSTHQSMMKAMHEKSPVERLDARIAAMEGRIKLLKEVKPALATLYAALNDEQRKKADQLMGGMGCMM